MIHLNRASFKKVVLDFIELDAPLIPLETVQFVGYAWGKTTFYVVVNSELLFNHLVEVS